MDGDLLFTCSRNVYNMAKFTAAQSLCKENFFFWKHLEMFCIFRCFSLPILLPPFVFLQNCGFLKTVLTGCSY